MAQCRIHSNTTAHHQEREQVYEDTRLSTQLKQREHDNYLWRETAAAGKRLSLGKRNIQSHMYTEKTGSASRTMMTFGDRATD